jgi:hypothetical protein
MSGVAGGFDDLFRELDEKLVEFGREDEEKENWGYLVALNLEGSRFAGWWLGRTTTISKYGERPVYLLQDEDGARCFLLGGRAALDREIDEAAPKRGERIVVGRGKDGQSEKGTFFRYVARSGPPAVDQKPPPLVELDDGNAPADDDAPF